MGQRPVGYSIERIKNNKGYNKQNCCWSTPKDQARNRRQNHMLTFNGETKCISAWSEIVGISSVTILMRIRRGWTTERALTTPVKKYKKRKNNG